MVATVQKAALLAIVLGLAATPARAAKVHFGQRHQLIFAADRLLPLLSYDSAKVTQKQTQGGTTVTQTQSSSNGSLSLLWGNGDTYALGLPDPYTAPRLGFDFPIIKGVTVGGDLSLLQSLGGSNGSSSSSSGGGATNSTSQSAPSYTMFGFSVRGGYMLDLPGGFVFWPRLGVSYFIFSTTTKRPAQGNQAARSSTTSANQLTLDVEPIFAYSPVAHVAITAGPLVDIPLTGGTKSSQTQGSTTQSTNSDFSAWHVGLSFGLVIFI